MAACSGTYHVSVRGTGVPLSLDLCHRTLLMHFNVWLTVSHDSDCDWNRNMTIRDSWRWLFPVKSTRQFVTMPFQLKLLECGTAVHNWLHLRRRRQSFGGVWRPNCLFGHTTQTRSLTFCINAFVFLLSLLTYQISNMQSKVFIDHSLYVKIIRTASEDVKISLIKTKFFIQIGGKSSWCHGNELAKFCRQKVSV